MPFPRRMRHEAGRRGAREVVRISDGLRTGLTTALFALCAACAAVLMTRDVNWRHNHDRAIELGDAAGRAGDYSLAERHYRRAVEFNPYSPLAHLNLGALLDRRLADNENAMKHYRYSQKFGGVEQYDAFIKNGIAILDMIGAGVLEDPAYALEDIFLAVEAGSLDSFKARLAPALAGDADRYWRSWRERGRGDLRYRRMRRRIGGRYDAALDIAYPDGTSMSMHFSCSPREPWRLSLAFP